MNNADFYKTQQSKAIEILKFPLACMVVAIHCHYFNSQHINQSSGQDAVYVKNIIDFISIYLTDCAVPLFFAISGYLYFLRSSKLSFRQYLIKTKGKIVTLLLPYFAWNIITILSYPDVFLSASPIERITGFWSMDCVRGSWIGPWDGPLWFLRDLFVVMLFSPVISWLIRKFFLLMPVALIILYGFGINAIFPGISITAFLFFSIGALCSIRIPAFSFYFSNFKLVVLIIMMAVISFFLRVNSHRIGYSLGEFYIIISKLLWICSSATVYFIIAVVISNNCHRMTEWSKIGASSFIIFAMHSLIIGRISSAFIFLIGKSNMNSILTLSIYFATIFLTVIVCYACYLMIKKNRLLSFILAGGRTR